MKPTNVVVVNASPKGEFSLTLQHAKYLLVHEPDIEASIIHVGENLTMMEYDETWLSTTFDALDACDMVIWATPVYTMLVPWQLVRFFDLMREQGRQTILAGKYATCIMSCLSLLRPPCRRMAAWDL